MAKRVIMGGNEALAEGAIRGGCDCYFGYPITPQNELTAYMAKHMPAHERVFVQAESEVAAISMVHGAAATGKRSMTSSSSPGVSLKQEGISYIAGAELPAVIVNVSRGGPGLGNIAPSQADYFQSTRGGGHGDYRTVVLAPWSAQELHDFAAEAFALADKYRNPVMILADGQIGQAMEPVELLEEEPARVDNSEWSLTGCKDREQHIVRSYFGGQGVLEKHNERIQAKLKQIEENEVRYDLFEMQDAETMIIAFGTSARLSSGAIPQAREKGIKVGMLRPQTLWPFPTKAINEQIDRGVKKIIVVEMSAGQLIDDVRLAVNGRVPVEFYGRAGGVVPTVSEILEQIEKFA